MVEDMTDPILTHPERGHKAGGPHGGGGGGGFPSGWMRFGAKKKIEYWIENLKAIQVSRAP